MGARFTALDKHHHQIFTHHEFTVSARHFLSFRVV
jgi:hypothetical protein